MQWSAQTLTWENLGNLFNYSESWQGWGGWGCVWKWLYVCPILRCPKKQLSCCQPQKKKQIVSFSSLYSMKGLILWKPEQKLSWPSETLIFSGQEMSLPDWPICCNFVGCVKTCDKVVTGDWSVMACFIMVYLRSSLFWGSVFKDWISREFCWSQEIP